MHLTFGVINVKKVNHEKTPKIKRQLKMRFEAVFKCM